jgi:cytidylate kinase
MERPLYVHFDGMDLAGKSTATRNFMEQTGGNWEMRRNSITPDNPIYLLADSLRRADAYDAEVLGNLYVAALMADLQSFKWPEANTVQDSTIILRSLAFHVVRGTPRIESILTDMLPYHPKFDASFVFTASVEERLKRLEMRAQYQPDQLSVEDFLVRDKPHKFVAMEACLIDFAQRSFHSVVIDTSTLTPDAVIGKIVENMPQDRVR